jgi:hypothetical protein
VRLGDVVHGLAFPRVSDGYVPVLADGFDLYLEGRERNYLVSTHAQTQREKPGLPFYKRVTKCGTKVENLMQLVPPELETFVIK